TAVVDLRGNVALGVVFEPDVDDAAPAHLRPLLAGDRYSARAWHEAVLDSDGAERPTPRPRSGILVEPDDGREHSAVQAVRADRRERETRSRLASGACPNEAGFVGNRRVDSLRIPKRDVEEFVACAGDLERNVRQKVFLVEPDRGGDAPAIGDHIAEGQRWVCHPESEAVRPTFAPDGHGTDALLERELQAAAGDQALCSEHPRSADGR